ncbi:CD74 molecule, major histocompatibility complex, class II invariant chain b [Engraulis encrasicolus]|uniref:CD74 molecule, major histocompatibility complex, class II invariant chain b n=1 Tax=Engraulis encrasicolus TaxID=184585 RepID=UPI002FCF6F47
MPENESVSDVPLVGTQQTSSGGSNKKALMAAGLTLLACLVVAGQGLTAYMVMGQKTQLDDLNLKMQRLKELSTRNNMATPVRMAAPMGPMHLLRLKDEAADTKDSAATPTPKDPSTLTQCEKEALGLTPSKVPGFKPQCDAVGGYQPRQCFQRQCWCVDATGHPISNSLNSRSCSGGVRTAQAFAAPSLLLQPLEEAKDKEN